MTKIYVSVDNDRFEATGEILSGLQEAQAELESNKIALEKQIESIEAAKVSAIAKLTALGLTEEEAKAVIGIA